MPGRQCLERFPDIGFQLGRERRLSYPFADLLAGCRQRFDIFDVEGIQRCIDAIVQPFVLEK